MIEGPLDQQIWIEEGTAAGKEVFATLLLKVQVCDALVQLRSQMNQGDIVLLKVCLTLYIYRSVEILSILLLASCIYP